MCRMATIGEDGFPHCVPTAYFYHRGVVYVPTFFASRKVRNLERHSKCSVIVDVYERGKGRGVMLQGLAKLAHGEKFVSVKRLVESSTGWKLDSWRLGQKGKNSRKPDTIITIRPLKTAIIGRLSPR